MCKVGIFAVIWLVQASGALEIDKKLTARILRVSDSKMTVLLNKGKEDGLEEGDHAKLSLPEKMIARAVVNRLSPSRSVWSIYRFYDREKVMENIAVTIKIASPVKLTPDESKSLGLLAKRSKGLPPKLKVDHQKIKEDLAAVRRKIKIDKVDYGSLESERYAKPFAADMDWSGLDGKKDLEGVDSAIDYSRLR